MTGSQKGQASRLRGLAGFVLLVFFTVVGLSYATRTAPEPSTLDGAILPGAPVPHRASVLDGDWMTAVQTWMNDRVLGRGTWLSLHAKISQDLLRVRVLNGIAVDQESGMLYEKPPTMRVRPDMGELAFQLGRDIRAAGSVPLFVYVPRKEEVFADRLPQAWPNTYLQLKPKVEEQLARGGELLDLTPVLSNPATRPGAYFLTDHHWSPTGALVGLDAIAAKAESMGVRLGPMPALTDKSYRPFYGSYARRVTSGGTPRADPFMIPTPQTWLGQLCREGTCRDPVFPAIASSSNRYINRYAAFLGGDVGYQELVNSSPSAHGTVLVLKDSYGLPLVTYLAQRASHVVAVDERKYQGPAISQLVRQLKPDLVLVLHNERTLLGDPTFNPDTWVRAPR